MNSIETAKPAVEGAHTVFFVTNYWEKCSAELEISQGKAVADASKAAGVKHLIFSSLLNVTEASKGALPHVEHFDSKAAIEQYIRDIGIPATFVQPGFYMSNYITQFKKNDDGSYTHAMPVDGEKAQVPVFDAAGDTGMCTSKEKPIESNVNNTLQDFSSRLRSKILPPLEKGSWPPLNT